jgi:kynurenine formamidase
VSEPREAVDLSAAEFDALFQEVSNWGRWGDDDERGTLNLLTPEAVVAAAGLVRAGETLTLSLPLDTRPALDNPEPAIHRMTTLGDAEAGPGSLRFAKDFIGLDYHHEGHSHIDALCHAVLDGALYNGRPQSSLTVEGAGADAIEALKDGLVARGVLLDVPRLREVAWLEPGEHVLISDLEGCEREQGVSVGQGDVLLVRTGHSRRRAEVGPWDTSRAKVGLHPTCARFLADRGVAALGSDGNNDTAPSASAGIDFPIHALALNAMGLHLLDYLQLDDVAAACERNRRWEFLFAAAPLWIPGGTGSPLNPTAIF